MGHLKIFYCCWQAEQTAGNMNTCQFILDKLLKTKYQMHDVWAFRKLCYCLLGAMETSLNGYTSLNFCNMTLDESGYQEFCSARIELLPGTHLGWNCWWRWYLAIMLWYFNYRWTARWMQFVCTAQVYNRKKGDVIFWAAQLKYCCSPAG